VVVVLGACGSHHGGGGGGGDAGLDGVTALAIAPTNQTLTIAQGVAATSQYTVTATYSDGSTADVTSIVPLSLADGTLGTFAAAGAFTSATDHGGTTQVVANAGSVQATTGLTLVFQQTYTDPGSTGLPNSTVFSGPADPTRAPSLVYPNDGVVVPPNLGRLEFHFMPGPNNTAFAMTFTNSVTDVTVYLACVTPLNGGCIYQPDATLWSWLSETNAGGDPVTWSLQGTDANGTGVGTSGSMTVTFSNDPINGGLYYWTTTAEAVMRYDFGSGAGSAATEFIGTTLENACIGCHALSHDGTKLVAEVNGQNDGRTALVDVATKTVMNTFGSTQKSIFESWSPDGSQYAAVYADTGSTNFNLMLLDGTTANLVSTIDVGASATHPADHPDWSSDGTRIAYVLQGIAGTCQRFHNGSIYQVAAAGGTPQLLVQAASNLENNYYPAFAPDNHYVVYDHSTCTSNSDTGEECDADSDQTATLMAVDSLSPGAPIALTNANKPGIADGTTTALTNTFPKWNPFVFQTTKAGGHLAWITFASTRKYGLHTPPAGTEDENASGEWLWMAAIDLDSTSGDPSSVAFALPFQDFTTSNHIAQWTEKVVQLQ
jgi:WD40-like Beta Propeller Repeat